MKKFIQILQLLLLFHKTLGQTGGCFFPESELRPFFYEISSSLPSGSLVADSIVDPPDAVLSLASVRASNFPASNFTDRFSLERAAAGRFSLVSASPLSLPSYPSVYQDTYLYVTVICNEQAYPLITVLLSAANTVSPQFYNEPYKIEAPEDFGVGSVLDVPVLAIDWDPSPAYNVSFKLEDPASPFILSTLEEKIRPEGIDDVSKWGRGQLPPKLRLELAEKVALPTKVKIVATDCGIPPRSSVTTVKISRGAENPEMPHFKAHASKIQESEPIALPSEPISFPSPSDSSLSSEPAPSFAHCYMAAHLKENAPKGTEVAKFELLHATEDTEITLVDPDGTFAVSSDGRVTVADSRLVDREQFSTLEVVAQTKGAPKGSSCSKARLRVDLLDENDNRPVFEKEKYWFHLSSEAPPGTEVAILKARDIDEDENGHVSYRLLPSSSDSPSESASPSPFRLSLRGRDAVLTTTADVSSEDIHHLVVEARDHGSPSRTSQVTVDVYILRSEIKGRLPKEESPLLDLPNTHPNKPEVVDLHELQEYRFVKQKKKSENPPVQGVVSARIDALPIGEEIRLEERVQTTREPTTRRETTIRNDVTTTTEIPTVPTEEPRHTTVSLPPSHPTLTNLVTESEREGTSREKEGEKEKGAGGGEQEEFFESGEEEKVEFAFTSDHYFYEVFGDPVEDDVIGRVVAEPNPQMYGLDRKVAGIFKMDSDIGEIAVGRKLYSQSAGNISFEVSATDGDSTARTVVTILFSPQKRSDDVLPRFDQSVYKFRIPENVSPEVIGIVRAFHLTATGRSSQNVRLNYDIVSDDPHLPFSIHQLSGEVANEAELDYEQKANYDFKVRACLSSLPSLCGLATVVVSVDDINDHPPRFSSKLQHVTLPSDLPVGSEVIRVKAIDEDSGSNGAVSYAITPPSAIFAIDYDSGSLVTISPLTESRYSILVEAFDHGIPKRSDVTEIRINVQGTNPSAPVFEKKVFESTVTGPVRAGSVVGQVTAKDPDPGPDGKVTYRFEDSSDPHVQKAQRLFQINERTGVVSAVSSLSSLDGPFDLVVEASDDSSIFKRKTSATIHIEIVGDSTIRFLPMPVTIYISTEKPVGSVILRASALTSSTSPVQFRIMEENSQFTMDGDLLRVATHLIPGRSRLSIRAESDSSHADHFLSVVVMSDRDKYPVFPQLTYDIDIPEEARLPLTVHRFDARLTNGSLRYEFFPPGQAPAGLILEENSGELTITSDYLRDPSSRDTVFVVVRATNTRFPQFFSDVGVALSIVSRRASIRFPQSIYRFEVIENSPVGLIIGSPIEVFPKDPSVRYSLQPDSFFDVHANGTIWVRTNLDLENLPVDRNGILSFVITGENGSDRTSAKVQIKVLDENEFSPEIDKTGGLVGSVREDAVPGTGILRIRAKDADFSEGTHLLYKIVGGSGRDLVFIQEDGTIILGETPLDRESMEEFDVQVEVYDRRGNMASATAVIKIEDANDNQPVVERTPLSWNIDEGVSDVTFPLSALDKDSGENGAVKFRIIQGNQEGHFEIVNDGNNKAHLHLLHPLSHKDVSSLVLTIEARDGGRPSQFTVTPIRITVNDVNDNTPQFKQKFYEQKTPIDLPIGLPIVTVAAKDDDGDQIEYKLQGDGCDILSIDPVGVVSFSAPVSKRTPGELKCTVEASDGVHTASAQLIFDLYSTAQPTVSSANRAPVFLQSDYSFSLREDSSEVGRVAATDPDGDNVLYSIRPAEYRNLFDIDAEGRLSLKVSPSDLSQSSYGFLVSAEDWGTPIMSAVANVVVHVPERISQLIDTTDSSVESDHPPITLVEGGRTTPPAIPERPETTERSKITETTEEMMGEGTLQTKESTRPQPTAIPIIKFIRHVYMYSIRSDAPIGTYLGEVQLTYKEGVSLSLRHTDRFSIDSSGRVRTNSLFEGQEKVADEIVATHMGQEIATVPFVVHIIATRSSTPPPTTIRTTMATTTTRKTTQRLTETTTTEEATSPPTEPTPSEEIFSFTRKMYFGFVPEGQYASGIRLPIKPEELATNSQGKVHYSISDSKQAMPFFLTDEGQLIVFDVDREKKDNYMIEIEARSSDSPPSVARSFINVTVLDVNDNFPQFVSHPDVFGLYRDVAVGTTVYQFKATDDDADASGVVRFEMDSDENGLFAIDPEDGTLSVLKELSSAPQEFSLRVTARDMGRPALKTHHKITIRLFDSHSPSPLLPSHIDTLSLPVNATPGTIIATLLAGPNVENRAGKESIQYGLSDNYSGLFEIDDNGLLKLARRPMDNEMGRMHQLNVTAENSLGTDWKMVNVLVEGEILTSPAPSMTSPSSSSCSFRTKIYNAEVVENLQERTRLTRVEADCQGAEYSLDRDIEEFEMDASTGEIFAVAPLDRERKSLYFLYVNAVVKEGKEMRVKRQNPVIDNAMSRLRPGQTLVVVRVSDENDNAPQFVHLTDGRMVANVDENSPMMTPILRLQAKDIDEHPALSYSLSSSDSSSFFSVNSSSGLLSLARPLSSCDDVTSFEMTASVSDGLHIVDVPVVIHKLSPSTNIVRLTSELPVNQVKEYQVERTLNELLDSDSRVLGKQVYVDEQGKANPRRTHVFIYSADRHSKMPHTKEKMMEMLSPHSASLLTSSSRISDVSLVSSDSALLAGTHIMVLILFLLLLLLFLLLCCFFAIYCRKKRSIATSSADHEYMFGSVGAGPRPYDVDVISRQTAQTVLAGRHLPDPLKNQIDMAVSPAFMEGTVSTNRSGSTKEFANSVRERPSLLQSALARHKVQDGGLSATVEIVPPKSSDD